MQMYNNTEDRLNISFKIYDDYCITMHECGFYITHLSKSEFLKKSG